MPVTKNIPVKDLKLDLANYRTVPQTSEVNALKAMISIQSEYTWGLARSLLESGYQPTQNIIVLSQTKTRAGKPTPKLVVKEGNRRIAVLKLLLGYIKRDGIELPSDLEDSLTKLDKQWKTQNALVPCAVYDESEEETVDAVVAMTHGKAEKAGRLPWNSVAKARHKRDHGGGKEPGLDLLEKFLEHGSNISADQATRWAGDYPLTILNELLPKLYSRFDLASTAELVANYPTSLKKRSTLDKILSAIGLEQIDYNKIRGDLSFLETEYALPAPKPPAAPTGASAPPAGPSGASTSAMTPASAVPPAAGTTTSKRALPKTLSWNEPGAVKRRLKQIVIRGSGREKVQLLLEEAMRLSTDKHPHAFCFLLRSMIELSAKAYCNDHKAKGGPKTTDGKGNDRKLHEVLEDIKNHLINSAADREEKMRVTKALHPAMTELGHKNGFLSVTSMNQLIHNPHFSIDVYNIGRLLGSVAPLIEELNA